MRSSHVFLLNSIVYFFFFFNDTATTEIYTLSLHDALPICRRSLHGVGQRRHRSVEKIVVIQARQRFGGSASGPANQNRRNDGTRRPPRTKLLVLRMQKSEIADPMVLPERGLKTQDHFDHVAHDQLLRSIRFGWKRRIEVDDIRLQYPQRQSDNSLFRYELIHTDVSRSPLDIVNDRIQVNVRFRLSFKRA